MKRRVENLIVGAGPTGLGAAWRLDARGRGDWLLVEAEPRFGGLAASVLDEHGFTWDLGGHVQFSHYSYFDDLMDDLLGPEGWIHHDRSSWVWYGDRFVPYPFQLNLRYLPPADRWEAVRGLLHRDGNRTDPPRHFGEWIERSFGSGISRIFLEPYNLKVWAYPLEELSWQWIGERVAVVDLDRVLRNIILERDDVGWGPNNKFRFPLHGGTGAVWRRLGEKLSERNGDRILMGRRLVELDTVRRRARFDPPLEVAYERLLSTIPIDVLVSSSDLAGELGSRASGLKYSSTHVVGVGLRGTCPDRLQGKCWMYFPGDDCPFYRVTVFSHYSPNNVPDIERFWSLMAEISESPFKRVRRETLLEDTVHGMLRTGLIESRQQIHHLWHKRLERGYPTPSRERDQLLPALMKALASRGISSRGRFGAWKYEVSNQDHSFAQGVEAVDAWLDGAVEITIEQPELVNSRRPVAR